MDELVTKFVNGKIQNKFAEISKAMEDFFTELEPIIADVYRTIKNFEAKTNAETAPNEIPDTLRKDYEGAVKGLHQYNRIFGKVDTQLAIMSSNFGLRTFLEENEFPSDKLKEFQYELNEYWQITYGDMINEWGHIRNKLEELRDILDLEVKMLATVPHMPYTEGCVKNPELRQLFYKERKTFYELMELYEATNNVLFYRVAAKLEVQLSRSKAELEAQMRIIKRDLKQDTSIAHTKIQKTLVISLYLIGAYMLLSNIKKSVAKHGLEKIKTFIRGILRQNTTVLDDKSRSILKVKRDIDSILISKTTEFASLERVCAALS
jgi:hypothetical protein